MLNRNCFLAVLIYLAAILGSSRALGQDFAASHLQAVEEYLVASGAPGLMANAKHEMTLRLLDHNPSLIPFEEVIREFFAELYSLDALGRDLVGLYAARFTEVELRELISFYRSPIGQKYVAIMPELQAETFRMADRLVDENRRELMRRLEQRAVELGNGASLGQSDEYHSALEAGNECMNQQDYQCAIEQYEQALEASPSAGHALTNLAWALATAPYDEYRDGERALLLASRAVAGAEQDGVLLENLGYLVALAAAYAELSMFDHAVRTMDRVLDLARQRSSSDNYVERYLKYRASFMAEQPWRFTPQ